MGSSFCGVMHSCDTAASFAIWLVVHGLLEVYIASLICTVKTAGVLHYCITYWERRRRWKLNSAVFVLPVQEIHQQLTIETRNMRKTRNFHQKLLKQERKNKGVYLRSFGFLRNTNQVTQEYFLISVIWSSYFDFFLFLVSRIRSKSYAVKTKDSVRGAEDQSGVSRLCEKIPGGKVWWISMNCCSLNFRSFMVI